MDDSQDYNAVKLANAPHPDFSIFFSVIKQGQDRPIKNKFRPRKTDTMFGNVSFIFCRIPFELHRNM